MPAPDNAPGLSPAAATILPLLDPDNGVASGHLPAISNLGKSTVQKALVTLESAGLARRVAGSFHEGARTPDLWFAAAAPGPAGPTPRVPVAEDSPETHEHPQASADCPQPAGQDAQGRDDANLAPVTDVPAQQDPAGPQSGPDTVAQAPDVPLAPDASPSEDAPPSPEAVTAPAETPIAAQGAPRLAKGALRQMVADYLQANPGLEITPGRVAKHLGRSTGAVSNAMDTLVEKGQARLTKDSPRTFRWTATDAR
jgi:DNA-binding transcriptional MocR family regulator